MTTSQHQEDLLDEALEETFPASDAPQAFQQRSEPSAPKGEPAVVFKRLLLATDLSERCAEMISRGIGMALAFEASIDLVHVRESLSDVMFGGSSDSGQRSSALELTDRALADTAQRIIDAGVPCQTTSLAGNPAHRIVAHALKTGADLIVLGGQGHEGILHSLFGGIAKRISKAAPCAVLVIPVREPVHRPGHHEGRSA